MRSSIVQDALQLRIAASAPQKHYLMARSARVRTTWTTTSAAAGGGSTTLGCSPLPYVWCYAAWPYEGIPDAIDRVATARVAWWLGGIVHRTLFTKDGAAILASIFVIWHQLLPQSVIRMQA